MARRDDLQKLIQTHQRRLQKLKEQQAVQGINVEPHIVIEIEDIEAELDKLQVELAGLPGEELELPAPAEDNRRRSRRLRSITARDLLRESLTRLISLDALAPTIMDRVYSLAIMPTTWHNQLSAIEAQLLASTEGPTPVSAATNGVVKGIVDDILSFPQAQEEQEQPKPYHEAPLSAPVNGGGEQPSEAPKTDAIADSETAKPETTAAEEDLPDWLAETEAATETPTEPVGNDQAIQLEPPPPEQTRTISKQPKPTLPNLKDIFLQFPRLSSMLVEEIQLYQKIRTHQLKTSFDKDELSALRMFDYEVANRLAQDLLQQVTLEELQPSLQRLDLRLQAVRHLLRLRKFAKLNALTSRWPELGRQLRDKISVLIELEAQAIQPQPLSEGTRIYKLWQQYRDDEALIAFLRLYPLFGDISPDELNAYFVVSQAIAPTTELTPETSEKAKTTPVSSQVETARREVQPRYQNLVISYDKADPAKNNQPLYRVKVEEPDLPPVSYNDHLLREVETVEAAERVTDQLRRLGENIYQFNFPAGVQQTLLKAALAEHNTRIILKLRALELVRLPWESLCLPMEPGMHVALSLRHSLVRSVDQIEGPTMPRLDSALRVLIVLTSPEDLLLPHTEREAGEIASALRRLDPSNLRILLNQEGTVANLHKTLVDFQPHVLHFTGHTRWSEVHKGAFVLRDGELPAEELAGLLNSQGPSLVVLNTVAPIDQEIDLVNSLFQAGVLAVIATTGPVKYEAASIFARTLYTFLGDGSILEEAVVQARLALRRKDLNWSLYVLFTRSPAALDNFRLFSQ
jgi:hypothetical protein